MRNLKMVILTLVLVILTAWRFTSGFAEDTSDFGPGEDSDFYYTIQKGDTLWDLSERFYDSEWDWPGLWKMNDEIKNPHLIYPGRKIRIFLKPKEESKPETVKVRKIKMPEKIKPSFSFSKMDHIGFLKKDSQKSVGSIIKEQDGSIMMSENDIIYIKPSRNGALIPDKMYHIFTMETVKKEIDNKEFEGVKHLIKATVKILEHKTTYAIGLITDAYRTVYKNDLVMEYYARDNILSVEETPEPIDARIICSEDDDLMVNNFGVASFINAGKNQIKPGQIYHVFRENVAKDYTLYKPKKEENIKLEMLESGKLIVLHTEDISSTVMILSSKYAIHPGDMVN